MNRTTLAVAALVFLAVVSSALAGTYTVTTPLAKDPLLEGARLLSNQRADPGSPFT